MPSARATHDLLRLLQDAAQPIYWVDDERRIVFLNQACCEWLGIPADDLLGRQCSYRSSESESAEAAADVLCPPPEAFHGRRTTARISKRSKGGQLVQRNAEFLPLRSEDGSWIGVLALVDAADRPADDEAADSDIGDEARQLHDCVARIRAELGRWHHAERLAGNSAAMKRVRAQVDLAAAGRSTVLIVGPVGSGRQHVARTIHHAQQSPGGTFVPVACATLPVEVLRSTIASLITRHGKPENNSPATMLLTEVHLMPAEIQSDVSRWFSERQKNIRVLATAAEPLETLAARGEFSAELAALLSTLVIELPPLAERREDIPLLAQMLLEDFNAKGGRQLRGFTPEALDRLATAEWRGEINELAAVVLEAAQRAEGFEITHADLSKRLHLAADAAKVQRKAPEAIDLEKFLAGVESELIERALREAKGNKSKAARLLGLTRPKLYRRMVALGMETTEEESG